MASRDSKVKSPIHVNVVAGKEELAKTLQGFASSSNPNFQIDIRYRGADASHQAPAQPQPERQSYARRLPVTGNSGSILYLRVEQIEWIEAENQYVRLHVEDKSYLVRMKSMTMKNQESRLDPELFLRVHRSHIVNLEHVISLHVVAPNKRAAHLAGGNRVPVSQTYWERLQDALLQL